MDKTAPSAQPRSCQAATTGAYQCNAQFFSHAGGSGCSGSGLTIASTLRPSECPKTDSTWRSPACLQPYNPKTHSQGSAWDTQAIAEGGGSGEGISRSSIPYSQHPQLLEPRKVVLMDPGDVVAVEFPGGGKERRKW